MLSSVETVGTVRTGLFFCFFASLIAGGCDCGDDPGGEDLPDNGLAPGQDASTGDGAQSDGGGDGSAGDAGDNDGATGDGATGDGATGDGGDGGPLDDPLSAFCTGMGTVVVVGGGGECAGEIAQETFQFGLCACDTITVQSQLTVDAFDSMVGPYDPLTRINDGHLGINGELVAGGKVSIYGSSYVGGGGFSVGPESLIVKNCYAAGTATQAISSTDIGRNAFFDGNVVGRFNIGGDLHVPQAAIVSQPTINNLVGSLIRGPIQPTTPCPCAPGEVLDVAGLTAWAATHNDNDETNVLTSTTWESGMGPDVIRLPCGRYYLTQIIHPRGLTIIAEDRTVLFVDGDMTIAGSVNLDIEPDAEIDLFIAGSLSIQAATRFGDPNYPSRVRTYVGGAGDIVFSASSEFGGNLYAPRANVYFEASTDLHGALFCNNGSFTGNASVHFDRAVRSAGEECNEDPDGGVNDGGPNDGGVADTGIGTDGGPPPDGGSLPDAGPPDTGGPAGCTSCNECAPTEGCVIPAGQTSGMCGACVFDTDCCPPLSCIAGVCMIDL
jgi:hypothetical protein